MSEIGLSYLLQLTWRGVVPLLRFRKDIWNVVPLIAPRVNVHRREENSECGVEHQAAGQRLRKSKSWSEVAGVRISEPARVAVLSADKNRGRTACATVEYQVCIRIADIHQRVHILVAQAHLDRGRA